MLALVQIFLPFAFSIPEGEEYTIYEYSIEGYRIRILPPGRSELADTYAGADSITIDGVKTFNADVLVIDFQKDDFDRTPNGNDPPKDLILFAANSFLSRLRYVSGQSKIKIIDFPNGSWNMTYLNDDRTSLPVTEGLVPGRGARKFTMSAIPLNKKVWENVHSIEPDYPIPVWRTLLLDADAILPEIGPAIVLIFTALEVFISKVLNEIASTGKVNNELWEWINDRGFFLKEPSIEEKYDFLSHHLIGKSLKANKELWNSFKELQKARNSFAHDGEAKIGDKIVTLKEVRTLLKSANRIIDFMKNEIPEELRWPEFKYDMSIGLAKEIEIKEQTNS